MTVTHVGTTKKYAAGWESIFGKQGARKKAAARGRPGKASGRKMSKGAGRRLAAVHKSGRKKAARGKSKTR
ncbi:MAG: hypothetical protein WD847_20915 [Pirellulales bacterium]